MRRLGVTVALLTAVAFGLVAGPSIWMLWGHYREAHAMHKGHIIVDSIVARDRSINATWTLDDEGNPNVVIRNVFDPKRQDSILLWAKQAKEHERLRGRIALDFQREISHDCTPDTILRSEQF